MFMEPRAFQGATRKSVALFGMSGVGKTYVSTILRAEDWFHYSVDYRIGAGYMREAIEDNLKIEAMRSPLLRELLMSDSACVRSKLTMDNLAPLSTFLGKPGDPARGGVPFDEYVRRQRLHRTAEIAAMRDAAAFIERSKILYNYDNFICDASGSLCEVVDPSDPDDSVLTSLSAQCVLLYIRGDAAHEEALTARFSRAPKPMYYQEDFLRACWDGYRAETGATCDSDVDPDSFMRWSFQRAIKRRAPIYQAVADHWGYETTPEEIGSVRDAADFIALIEAAVARAPARAFA